MAALLPDPGTVAETDRLLPIRQTLQQRGRHRKTPRQIRRQHQKYPTHQRTQGQSKQHLTTYFTVTSSSHIGSDPVIFGSRLFSQNQALRTH